MVELFPKEFYLSQNHPNPFKERTIIKYCVPEEAKVKIEIVDYEKRTLQILVDEVKEPGTYQVILYANGFREGLYLYTLTSGSIIITKRMLILK